MPNYFLFPLVLKSGDKSNLLEDELADALEEMARDTALIEPDPMDWGGWVIYLMVRLNMEAQRESVLSELIRVVKS